MVLVTGVEVGVGIFETKMFWLFLSNSIGGDFKSFR